jgi:hypothetical protein
MSPHHYPRQSSLLASDKIVRQHTLLISRSPNHRQHSSCALHKHSIAPYFALILYMLPLGPGNLIRRPQVLRQFITGHKPRSAIQLLPSHLNFPNYLARMSSQAKRLAGKTILITGASSGIGKSTALEFARTQPDIKLILTARREETLKEVKGEIEGVAKGVKIHVVKLDVSNVEEIGQFVGKLPEEFKEIDVLVNNA